MKGRKKSEFPRGYKVEVINKTLNIGGKSGLYEVYVVEHKSLAGPKTFVDKESAVKFINECERNKIETKALKVSGYQHVKGVAAAHKDAIASVELADLVDSGVII